jgi:hypothetical protein
MKFFNREFKEGMPISVRGFARGIMAMARALGEMRGIGCHLEWSGMGIPTIVVDQPTDLSQPLPDSNRAELNQKSIQEREIDEETGESVLQIFAFDDDDVTEKGLKELITADTVTGEISAESDGEKYQLVTRIKTDGGYMIGYMPLGEGDGEEEEMPEDEGAKCDQNEHPATGEGYGNGSAGGGYVDGADDHPAAGGGGGDPDEHPAVSDCYTTAA